MGSQTEEMSLPSRAMPRRDSWGRCQQQLREEARAKEARQAREREEMLVVEAALREAMQRAPRSWRSKLGSWLSLSRRHQRNQREHERRREFMRPSHPARTPHEILLSIRPYQEVRGNLLLKGRRFGTGAEDGDNPQTTIFSNYAEGEADYDDPPLLGGTESGGNRLSHHRSQ
jgi:hypothetical protein